MLIKIVRMTDKKNSSLLAYAQAYVERLIG